MCVPETVYSDDSQNRANKTKINYVFFLTSVSHDSSLSLLDAVGIIHKMADCS